MKIAVVGSGYVGLVLGACLAETGNDVICVDKDTAKVRSLRRGRIPIYEPGLSELVTRNAAEGRLSFTTQLGRAVKASQIIFIAVGTPQGEDGSADLQHVLGVAREIGRTMNGYRVIVNKSTVPVGTAEKVRAIIGKETKHPFSVVSNPEFLKQGAAVDDFMKPDRVVIGTDHPKARELLRHLYAPFVRTSDRIHAMDARSAELTKYAANALLATRISFMNDLAILAEKVGADIELVRRGVGSDPRIGPKFLFPGPGYGGSCFPKDILALLQTGLDAGHELAVVRATDEVNRRQKKVLGEKVLKHFGGSGAGRTVAIWGLSFKPQTDDIREAPALTLIDDLLAAGFTVQAHDPEAMPNVRAIYGDKVLFADGMYGAAEGADALVLVTEWHEYRTPDFHRLKKLMRSATLFDGRNTWVPDEVRELGFTYAGIGRR
jgi:UDPglucose 6-dehydrogenase